YRQRPLQVQDDLARSEEERVAGTAREELDRGGRLPLVGLETQWHGHELGLPGSRRRGRPPVFSRGRGGVCQARAEKDRNYLERRYCPKRERPVRNRRPLACHTRCSSLC